MASVTRLPTSSLVSKTNGRHLVLMAPFRKRPESTCGWAEAAGSRISKNGLVDGLSFLKVALDMWGRADATDHWLECSMGDPSSGCITSNHPVLRLRRGG
jgi:hypothetical protein